MRVSHGLFKGADGKKSRLYHIWEDMKSRCLNPKNRRFKSYGGKGVTICNQWLTYPAFHQWAMANGYTDDLTIDRIEVSGSYEPDNCRWATQKEQANNRTTNIMISFNGKTQSMGMWSTELGFPKHILRNRIKRGWSIQRALTTPKQDKYAA